LLEPAMQLSTISLTGRAEAIVRLSVKDGEAA